MDILNFIASFFKTTEISMPEAVMFICFGMSWPVSVIKALKTKTVTGKSPLFMSLIALGYLCGISHKVLFSRDFLIILYLVNLSMILTDLWLYVKYNTDRKGKIKTINLSASASFLKGRQDKGQPVHEGHLNTGTGHFMVKREGPLTKNYVRFT